MDQTSQAGLGVISILFAFPGSLKFRAVLTVLRFDGSTNTLRRARLTSGFRTSFRRRIMISPFYRQRLLFEVLFLSVIFSPPTRPVPGAGRHAVYATRQISCF